MQTVEFFINNYGVDEPMLTVSLIAAIVLFPAAAMWNWRHGETGAQSFRASEIGAYVVFGIAAVLRSGRSARVSLDGQTIDLVFQ